MTSLSNLINAYWDTLAEAGPKGVHEAETALVSKLVANGATKVQAKALVRGMKDNGPEPEQEPEDPDKQRVRDLLADRWLRMGALEEANRVREARADNEPIFKTTLKALKLGRELERSEQSS